MKTAAGLMSRINQISKRNGNVQNKDILEAIKEFEHNIMKEQREISVSAIKNKAGCCLTDKGKHAIEKGRIIRIIRSN